jgi:hypothetical protein
MRLKTIVCIASSALVGACLQPAPQLDDNPFLTGQPDQGKADTAYQNPDGIEVELDIEGDVEVSAAQHMKSPVMLAQFATTYLSKRGEFYLESLAEDQTSPERVEWLVDDTWISAAEAEQLDPNLLTHFRMRGVNAVLLHEAMDGVQEGTVFEAAAPTGTITSI